MADTCIARGNLGTETDKHRGKAAWSDTGECHLKMEAEAEIRLLQVESRAPSGWKGQGRNLPLRVSEKAWSSFTLTLESYLQNYETTSFCGSELLCLWYLLWMPEETSFRGEAINNYICWDFSCDRLCEKGIKVSASLYLHGNLGR